VGPQPGRESLPYGAETKRSASTVSGLMRYSASRHRSNTASSEAAAAGWSSINRNATQHMCFNVKKHMDFFIFLFFSPVTTGAGDRRACPGARARAGHGSGGGGGSVICPSIEKKIMICDLLRLKV